MWLGLTGGIASGKSTVAQILKEQGFPVIDADEIAHQVVSPGSSGLQKVVVRFGIDYMNPDGSLDRGKLGTLVFRDSRARMDLEAIVHPLVQAEVERLKQEYTQKGHRVIFYDVPLLFEKKLEKNFDAVILVASDEKLQRERLKSRDGLDAFEIENRIRSQWPMKKKEEKAQFIIRNNGTFEDLRKATLETLSVLTNKKK